MSAPIDASGAETVLEMTASRDGVLATVAISLYNYADEIGACLDSVAAQTYPRLELIVVDDASRDSSVEAAKAWMAAHASRFDRMLLLRQPANRGLSAARNLAFAQARADHVFVLDADNLLFPRALSLLLEAVEDSGAAVAYSQLVHFGAGVGVGVSDLWRPEGFRHDNYVDAMALVSKAAWAEVGGYSPIDYGWEDYDFWCKFVEAGLQGVYVPELLCRYCVRTDSMVRTDTTAERERLVHLMMAAHPWLDLKV